MSREERKKNPLYKPLSPAIEKLSERIGLRKVPEDYIKKFIKDVLPTSTFELDKYKEHHFALEKFKKKKRFVKISKQSLRDANNQEIKGKKRKTLLNASEHRRLATYKLDPEAIKFQHFLPMHELWEQYMKKLLHLKESLSSPDPSTLYPKLLKADYHGCHLVVSSSRSPSLVGLRGIVVQETKNVFKVVTEEDKLKSTARTHYYRDWTKIWKQLVKLNGSVFRMPSGRIPTVLFSWAPDGKTKMGMPVIMEENECGQMSSHSPSLVGLRGIFVQGTKNVFKVVTEEDKLITLPKAGSVFCFQLVDNIFKIYGDNFRFLPYERIRVKYKTKNLVYP